jgi:hypothetical protein
MGMSPEQSRAVASIEWVGSVIGFSPKRFTGIIAAGLEA